MGVVGGGMPETGAGERRHVPLYGRLVAEEQLASMSAPSDIQVSAAARDHRAFCRYCTPTTQVNDARGSFLGSFQCHQRLTLRINCCTGRSKYPNIILYDASANSALGPLSKKRSGQSCASSTTSSSLFWVRAWRCQSNGILLVDEPQTFSAPFW